MAAPASSSPRGTVLRGRVWPGGPAVAYDDGVVVLDPAGRVVALGAVADIDVPSDLPMLGDATSWVGPGVIDAHVHLAFGSAADVAAGGVVAARDLGAPLALATGWRTTGRTPFAGSPHVAVAGPIITAPGGYPSRGWGRDGFASFVADPAAARAAVQSLVGSVDVVKVALEPTGGPVPSEHTVAAIVIAAHEAGLAVTAHALTIETVRLAVRAGVDELAHTPIELLPAGLVQEIVAADVLVVSTIQTFVDGDAEAGANAIANATALHAAGVRICYGSDLGNAGTSPGVDPRELRRLADTGLGAEGALRAATDGAVRAAGISGVRGALVDGDLADAVVLAGDPLEDAQHWRTPTAVFVAGRRIAAPGVSTDRP